MVRSGCSMPGMTKPPLTLSNNKALYLVFCGKAGSGKDYLLNKTLHFFPQINRVVSYTTRPSRDGEIDGIDYNFISNDEAESLIKENRFLEFRVFRDWIYGTPIDSFKSRVNAGISSPGGLLQMKDNNEIVIYPIYVEAPSEVRKERYLNRTTSIVDDWSRRYAADEEDFKNIYQLLDDNFDSYSVVTNIEEVNSWHNLKWIDAIIKKMSIYC